MERKSKSKVKQKKKRKSNKEDSKESKEEIMGKKCPNRIEQLIKEKNIMRQRGGKEKRSETRGERLKGGGEEKTKEKKERKVLPNQIQGL